MVLYVSNTAPRSARRHLFVPMPAVTAWVSADLALANFLASRSFGNVSVALACVLFPGPSSNETYHVPLDLRAIMRRSRRYAGGSPSATSRNFSEFCISPSVTSRTSIEGDRIRSARHRILTTRQPSGFVFRGGRWARKSLGKADYGPSSGKLGPKFRRAGEGGRHDF